MTNSTETPPTDSLDALTEEGLTGRSDAAGEPSWLRDQRLAAYKRYVDQAWPDSRQDEFWRSTPFGRIPTDLPLVSEVGDGVVPASGLVDTLERPAAKITIVDGVVVEQTVPAELAEQGVVVADLATAAEEHADLVRAHLGSLTTSSAEGSGSDEDRTITVNDAAWTAGAFVYVPDQVELSTPIGIHVHVSRSGAHLPRTLAVVGRQAKATLYLEHTGGAGADPLLVDEIVEGVVLDGGHLDIASMQEWDDGVTHLSLQKVAAHRDAQFRHLSVTVGGRTVRLRPECDLLGPGSEVRPRGVYFADAGQWFDLQPYVRHFAPHATSDVLFKGALQGKSRTVFRGNIFVGKEAVGTVTDETNRSLILTDGARADSTPFLEIECSDITAGHGSATGQIDARHLFYLEARGIPRDAALRLIVHGFFREVLAELDLPGVEERALAHIEREVDEADLDAIGVSDAALREEYA
jgi:Fe-S cluster assembly protein SufD